MATINRKIIAPRAHPETELFWQAAGEGQLLVKKCSDCGEVHYYPRAICPHCLGDRTEWLTTTGRGTIYSYSTMGKAESAYTLAYVTLDEGVTMLTNLIDSDPAALAIGQPVSVVFVPTEGGPPVPMFRPA